MKTRESELEEMIDVVIKLTWGYIVFRALFEKGDANREARTGHPELFLTMHDSLLCAFCVATALLFDEKKKATSLWSLIRNSKPEIATKLSSEIHSCVSLIDKFKDLRHQVFAHRWQAKTPEEVVVEVGALVGNMTKVVELAKFVICELAGEVDEKRKQELEQQQLSERTMQAIAADAYRVIKALGS